MLACTAWGLFSKNEHESKPSHPQPTIPPWTTCHGANGSLTGGKSHRKKRNEQQNNSGWINKTSAACLPFIIFVAAAPSCTIFGPPFEAPLLAPPCSRLVEKCSDSDCALKTFCWSSATLPLHISRWLIRATIFFCCLFVFRKSSDVGGGAGALCLMNGVHDDLLLSLRQWRLS